ncbi:anaphase-promoting complex, subunit 10-domain-containing protein [Halteromyces radiatus]|uniref:anaphase-promoting complex, subunit 10-domain-containing protein n=1 Tax=Halteromyces radiatus TaxID=101107 RepID=UPI00221FD898|nr:anaphase-promoting complex, subunit 10-domain-containing protein [Halteromyces radiatus]KAI8096620.1 anaphase-promoting complex, subunit 10-domain-containing protein [Halteromyces radiatus]
MSDQQNDLDLYMSNDIPDNVSMTSSQFDDTVLLANTSTTATVTTTTHYTDFGHEDRHSNMNQLHSSSSVSEGETDMIVGYLDSDPMMQRQLLDDDMTEAADDDDDAMDQDRINNDNNNNNSNNNNNHTGDDDEDTGILDDSERENTAIRIYHDTHPDNEQKLQGGREIAEHEAIWAVSTFRPDWGVEKIRDNNPLTYWQSDSSNPRTPHTVDLYFHQATFIKQVSIFVDFFQDESYSPHQISIRGGTTYRDLHEIVELECEEMVGWKNADLSSIMDEPVRVFQLQIAILSTHLNGRDTHIRQIKVYSVPLPYLQETDETDGELKIHPANHKGLR